MIAGVTHRRRLKKIAAALNSVVLLRQEATSGPREVDKANTGRQNSFLRGASVLHFHNYQGSQVSLLYEGKEDLRGWITRGQ